MKVLEVKEAKVKNEYFELFQKQFLSGGSSLAASRKRGLC